MGVAPGGLAELASVFTILEAVRLELLLFAGFWFTVGAIDELVVDGLWLWLVATGRARTRSLFGPSSRELSAPVALFVPAWQEARVIGAMLGHCLRAWRMLP